MQYCDLYRKNKEDIFQLVKNFSEKENNYLNNLPNGNTIKDSYYGLLPVHDNYDIFKYVKIDSKNDLLYEYSKKEYLQWESTIVDKDEFYDNFDIFTERILENINWNNVCMAGGSVEAILRKIPKKYCKNNTTKREWYHNIAYPSSDIDLFIYGLSDRECTKKLYELYESITKMIPKNCKCIRSSRAITIVSEYPYRHVQLILKNHQSPAEILLQFDVDSCMFLYDGNKVWCTPRAHYAITRFVNTIDLSKRSNSYEFRLNKYSKRGYAVHIPNLDKSRINNQIYMKGANGVTGLARLLVLEYLDDKVKFDIYKDVLDNHQACMRKNIDGSQEYQESDYSIIYLPWGEGHNAESITQIINNKNKMLNKIDKREFTDYTFDKNSNNNVKSIKYKRKIAIIGTIYEVVRDLVETPLFEKEEDYELYAKNFVSGSLKWYHTNDKNSPFNRIKLLEDEWYYDAYVTSQVNELCSLITNLSSNYEDNIKSIGNIIDTVKLKNPNNIDDKGINIDMIRLLNSKDITNRNPLHLAIQNKHYLLVKLFLELGVNPLIISKLKKTALHCSCEVGNLEIIKLMVEHCKKTNKFNINIKDSYGLTPALYTILYDHFDAFKYFMDNGVKYEHISWKFKYDKNKNYEPLVLTLNLKRYNFAEYLLSHGYGQKEFLQVFRLAVSKNDINFINLLLKYSSVSKLKNKNLNSHINEYSKILLNSYQSKIKYRKYICDIIYKLYQTHENITRIYDLISYMVKEMCYDDLFDFLNKNKLDANINLGGKNILDIIDHHIINLSNDIRVYENKIDFKEKGTFNINTKPIFFSNIVNQKELSKELYKLEKMYIKYPRLDVCDSKIDSKTEELSNVDVNKLKNSCKNLYEALEIHHVNKFKLMEMGAKNNYQILSLDSFTNVYNQKKIEYKIMYKEEIPINIFGFKNLDDEFVNDNLQIKYIELYEAIDNNDFNKIKQSKLHLGVKLNLSGFTPIDYAIYKNKLEILPKLIQLINEHYPVNEKKQESVKKNKIYLNNKKIEKKQSNKSKKHEESDEESYEESDSELSEEDIEKESRFGYPITDFFKNINKTFNLGNVDAIKVILNLNDANIGQIITNKIDQIIQTIYQNNLPVIMIEELIKFSKNNNINVNKRINYGLVNNNYLMELLGVLNKYNLIDIYHLILPSCIIYNNNNDNYDEILERIGIIKTFEPSLLSNEYDGETLLMKYCNRSCFNNLNKVLIDVGSDINYSTDDEYIVHRAVTNVEILKYLIEKGINVNRVTKVKNQSVLMLAIKEFGKRSNFGSDILELFDTLIEISDCDIKDIFGNTVLHYASIFNNYYIMKKLKYHNIENNFRMTPSDYIINQMKYQFHHSRNDKIKKKFNLDFLEAIYNNIVKKYNSVNQRKYVNDEYILKTNKYIFNNIQENDKFISEKLLV